MKAAGSAFSKQIGARLGSLGAVLFLCALWPACALSAGAEQDPSPGAAQAVTAAFSLKIQAPDDVAEALSRHLELQRYKNLHDLDAGELQRLIEAADTQARELLATRGHFSPTLGWTTTETFDPAAPRWQVELTVAPGPQARVEAVQWQLQGHLQDSDKHLSQRQALLRQWALPPGKPFTQQAWSQAKSEALQQLTAEHYPLGRWVRTEARVDPVSHRVVIELVLDSGPEVFLGPVHITGQDRYSLEQARRLAHVPTGRSFRQSDLLEAQQRLVLSGFYDTVFVSLDTNGPAQAMPVRIELRETPLQRWQMGLGVRSDSGPRLTLEHTHHRVPALQWRAVTKLSVDRLQHNLGVELLAPPNDSLWRWNLSGRLARQDFVGYTVTSQRWSAGRSQLGERADRSYSLQYDLADHSDRQVGVQESLSANYSWTWRRFDTVPFPTRGWGLGLSLGAGTTLGVERLPFTRGYTRVLGLWPIGERGHRLSLRGEVGGVRVAQAERLPSTQLFVTGGDTSVRGYGPNSIGIVAANGRVNPGRYLGVASAEWLIPLRKGTQRSDWDALLFVDAGAVADSPSGLRPKVGAGFGARWRSPVGPLEIDLAQARETGQWRLHLSLGFGF